MSNSRYALTLLAFLLATLGISSSVAGLVGTFGVSVTTIKTLFTFCMVVGAVLISVLHWTKGRYM